MKNRFQFLFALLAAFALLVVGRATWIQIIGDHRLVDLSSRQFGSKTLLTARRGLILDRNGEALAINTEAQSLAANPQKILNKPQTLRQLSKVLKIPFSTLKQRLYSDKEFVWIKRHIPELTLQQFKNFGLTNYAGQLIPGLWFVKESYRTYPHKELAAQTIGTVNLDNIGAEGVELLKNSSLEGKVTSMRAIKDALGRPTLMDASIVGQIQDGENITLTIDSGLQFSVEENLAKHIEKTKSKAGSVIVMDAVSGEILALANYPNYDLNLKNSSLDSKRNRAFTDGFEPGSTVKPILLASALANGSKITDQIYGENGSFTIQKRRISEAEAHEKFQWISLSKMIQVSSNVASAKLALKLGYEKWSSALKSFGFGSKTNSMFPGEISGILPSTRKTWQPLTIATTGFGQSLLATPIQITRAYASFINGGWLVTPKIVRSQDESPANKQVISEKVANDTVSTLRLVTLDGGTGTKAALEGYSVAGKTGTAQAVDPKTGKYSRTHYRASFVGFPVDVEQKIVIFTLLDEPKGVYYASETAAPLFRDVLNSVVTRFAIPPTNHIQPRKLASEKNSEKSESDKVQADKIKLEQSSRLTLIGTKPDGKKYWTMPSMKGLSLMEALSLLKGQDFKIETKGQGGLVSFQSPKPGDKILEGSLIKIQLE